MTNCARCAGLGCRWDINIIEEEFQDCLACNAIFCDDCMLKEVNFPLITRNCCLRCIDVPEKRYFTTEHQYRFLLQKFNLTEFKVLQEMRGKMI